MGLASGSGADKAQTQPETQDNPKDGAGQRASPRYDGAREEGRGSAIYLSGVDGASARTARRWSRAVGPARHCYGCLAMGNRGMWRQDLGRVEEVEGRSEVEVLVVEVGGDEALFSEVPYPVNCRFCSYF